LSLIVSSPSPEEIACGAAVTMRVAGSGTAVVPLAPLLPLAPLGPLGPLGPLVPLAPLVALTPLVPLSCATVLDGATAAQQAARTAARAYVFSLRTPINGSPLALRK
jgi:hypothetical protein